MALGPPLGVLGYLLLVIMCESSAGGTPRAKPVLIWHGLGMYCLSLNGFRITAEAKL